MVKETGALLLVFLLLFSAALLPKIKYYPAKIEKLEIKPYYGIITLSTGGKEIPIYVSYEQAIALRDALNKTKHKRPTTHDIAAELAEFVGVKSLKIEKIVNGTYYAVLETNKGNIDIRPSDGLIICANIGCRIYVNADLLK